MNNERSTQDAEIALYTVKLLELRERLKEYTGFDYPVIPESIVEAGYGCPRTSFGGI